MRWPQWNRYPKSSFNRSRSDDHLSKLDDWMLVEILIDFFELHIFILWSWVLVWIAFKLRLRFGEAAFSFFSFFFFFFFSRVFGGLRLLFNEQCMNSSHKCWLFPVNSASVHCLWTHKFHFSATFSLKMGLTALFTHLKIILLQRFQFSAK